MIEIECLICKKTKRAKDEKQKVEDFARKNNFYHISLYIHESPYIRIGGFICKKCFKKVMG